MPAGIHNKRGDDMYEVLLAVKSIPVLDELKKLHIWGDPTGFRIADVTDCFDELILRLQKKKYDLLLLENLPDNHMTGLLRKIKNENLCNAVAVVCNYVDFKTVRKSFLLGADDFFVTPFEVNQFITLFSKIENADHGKIAAEICRKEEFLRLFEAVDFTIQDRLEELVYHALSESGNHEENAEYMKRILDSVVLELFEKYEWLDLYFDKNEFLSAKYELLDPEEGIHRNAEDFLAFFSDYSELYPRHGENLEIILQYILRNPESDLKQKTISRVLYINRSYLSTVFTAQTNVNFVEYVNNVKLKRAAWMLKHTKMKVIDIAGALDYKDMGYFLKRFKAKYGVTPSQYRIPETYEFQI